MLDLWSLINNTEYDLGYCQWGLWISAVFLLSIHICNVHHEHPLLIHDLTVFSIDLKLPWLLAQFSTTKKHRNVTENLYRMSYLALHDIAWFFTRLFSMHAGTHGAVTNWVSCIALQIKMRPNIMFNYWRHEDIC